MWRSLQVLWDPPVKISVWIMTVCVGTVFRLYVCRCFMKRVCVYAWRLMFTLKGRQKYIYFYTSSLRHVNESSLTTQKCLRLECLTFWMSRLRLMHWLCLYCITKQIMGVRKSQHQQLFSTYFSFVAYHILNYHF